MIHRSPQHLLRTHVRQCAHHYSLRRTASGADVASHRLTFGSGDLRQSEVQHLHLAPRRQHDVGRLDVTVRDPFAVGFIQCVGDLNADVHDVGSFEGDH